MTDTERCDREIAEILERPDVVGGQAPAWLVVLGTEDWAEERKMIMESQRQELRARYIREANGASWIDWIEDLLLAAEKRIAELTADESPRQAAERIVQSHVDDSKLTDEDLRTQITTAIQAAVEAEREHGRKALEEAKAETVAALADAIESSMECSEIDHVAHAAQFMAKFGQHVGDTPGWPPQEVLDLRMKLGAEEFCEKLMAAGYCFELRIGMRGGQLWFPERGEPILFSESVATGWLPDFPEFVDACIDSEYVNLGDMIACGVDPQPIWEAVHAANMAKQPAADKFSKITKPDGWTPPDIAGALREQGWAGAE